MASWLEPAVGGALANAFSCSYKESSDGILLPVSNCRKLNESEPKRDSEGLSGKSIVFALTRFGRGRTGRGGLDAAPVVGFGGGTGGIIRRGVDGPAGEEPRCRLRIGDPDGDGTGDRNEYTI